MRTSGKAAFDVLPAAANAQPSIASGSRRQRPKVEAATSGALFFVGLLGFWLLLYGLACGQ
jgi:hypothetical protein